MSDDEKFIATRIATDKHTEVKVRLAREGRTIADLLRELIDKWLTKTNGNGGKSENLKK